MAKNILYIGNKLHSHGRTPTTIDTLAPLLVEAGYAVQCASSKIGLFARMADMILKTLKLHKWANYVLIDTYSTKNFWYAIVISFLCKLLKLKYIPILHGGNLPHRLQTHPQLFTNFLKGAHAVVSPSDFLRFAFAKAIPTPITRIPNNLKLDQYPFKKREKLTPKLLWVRSFARVYNPMLALQVLELLLVVYPDARLTMVGPEKDGSLATCRHYAKLKRLPVTFTGLLAKEAWVQSSRTHDVLLNTSDFDNLPVSVLEAMALGLVVVSTQVGGMPFLIEHGKNGLLVPPQNAQAMMLAVQEVIENQKLAKFLMHHGQITAEAYDWQVIKPQWQALLG